MSLFDNMIKSFLIVGSIISLITSIAQVSNINKLTPLEVQGILSSATFIIAGLLVKISYELIDTSFFKIVPLIITFIALSYFIYTIYSNYNFMIRGALASQTTTFLAICVFLNSLIAIFIAFSKKFTDGIKLNNSIISTIVTLLIMGTYSYIVYRTAITMTLFVTDG